MKVRIKCRSIELNFTKKKAILIGVNQLKNTSIGMSWLFYSNFGCISIDFVFIYITYMF